MTEEETRAAAYRRDQLARVRHRKDVEARLRGDTAAALAVRKAWDPVRRDAGWDPPVDDTRLIP